MKKFRFLFFMMALFSFLNIKAQNKEEREFRIDMSKYPENTQKVLLNIPIEAKRIRHYQETDGDKLSYESKFKFNRYWYSVEFGTTGILEDIERTIRKKHLPVSVRDAINSYLKVQSSKYDIVKIQEQYIYNKHISEVAYLNSILRNNEAIDSNYEVIIALKIDKLWSLKEMTFNSKGRFLNARKLQPDSYEYIMY